MKNRLQQKLNAQNKVMRKFFGITVLTQTYVAYIHIYEVQQKFCVILTPLIIQRGTR